MTPETDLTGKVLIAMPAMGDPRFYQSVIYLTRYSDEGAMGLIINKPVPQVRLYDLIDQIAPRCHRKGPNLPIHFGGPVERERGFVLHSDDYAPGAGSLHVAPGFTMSATLDVLRDLAEGTGPRDALIMLGYAGWGPGQLDQELLDNAWLTSDVTTSLVFSSDNDNKWEESLACLGISPLTLSSEAGHA